ncbi:MAG: hypothetical protein IAF58_19440, partial [Leptolyngbya sp.]|nr:hypothetical protein [Candidatus Melainabacteria bacterium]
MLVGLRSKPFEESDWKIISELLKSRTSNALYDLAEEWLLEFPASENATRLVGTWLAVCGSTKATSFAIRYLNENSANIKQILCATTSFSVRSSELYDVIGRHLELSPTRGVWCHLQTHGKKKARNDKLIQRWLSLNLENDQICREVSIVALFSTSEEVINSVISWSGNVGERTSSYWIVLSHLLLGTSEAHQKFQERIIQLARDWTNSHSDDDNCGKIIGYLLRCKPTIENIGLAIEWYREHSANRTAFFVLIAILLQSRHLELEIDPYVLDESMD